MKMTDFECLICCQPEHQTFVTPACCGTPICLPCYSDISARVPSYVAGPACPFCRTAFDVWDADRLKERQGDILRRASAAALDLNARSERVAHYESRIKYYQAALDSERPSLQSEQKMYEILVREAALAKCVDEVQALIVTRASRMMPAAAAANLMPQTRAVHAIRPPPVIIPRRTAADIVAGRGRGPITVATAAGHGPAAVAPGPVAIAPAVAPGPAATAVAAAATKRCAGCATNMPEAQVITRRARWPRTAGGPPAERRALVRCLACYNRYS